MKHRKMIWIFPLLICGIIFFLSLQNSKDTMAVSHYVQETVKNSIRSKPVNPDTSWIYNIAKFRKLAHIPEYFALGNTMMLAIFVDTDRKKYASSLSIISCGLISILDQTIKFLLSGREFDLTDIGFDFIGYLCGTFLVGMIYFLLQRIWWPNRKKMLDK